MRTSKASYSGLGLAAFLTLASAASESRAIELPAGFTDTRIAGNLNPTLMRFAPDGRLFVNEKDGKIRVVKNGALLPAPFATVSTDPFNERGLLGIDFDPDFARNHFLYVFYTTREEPIRSRISRFTAKGDVAAGPETVIFEIDGVSEKGNHNGGAIAFGKDGKLYIAVGNNAVGSTSQSQASLFGKLLRINADGTIPGDNPFAGSATGKHRAIWALGFRNPYTFAIQPGTGRIFVNDVGGSTFEEVTEAIAGTNHGFPRVEGDAGTPPNGPGDYKAPFLAYGHEGRNCAITGGTFFNPPRSTFPAGYAGHYFFVDYCAGWIKSMNPAKGNAVTQFATGLVGPVDILAGPDGQLYYLTRGITRGGSAANTATTTGELHRIKGPETPTRLANGGWDARRQASVASVSGLVRLRWPRTAGRAVLHDAGGRRIAVLKRPGNAAAEASSLPVGEGLYHVRFLP